MDIWWRSPGKYRVGSSGGYLVGESWKVQGSLLAIWFNARLSHEVVYRVGRACGYLMEESWKVQGRKG